jgi:hypothetical protein
MKVDDRDVDDNHDLAAELEVIDDKMDRERWTRLW